MGSCAAHPITCVLSHRKKHQEEHGIDEVGLLGSPARSQPRSMRCQWVSQNCRLQGTSVMLRPATPGAGAVLPRSHLWCFLCPPSPPRAGQTAAHRWGAISSRRGCSQGPRALPLCALPARRMADLVPALLPAFWGRKSLRTAASE